MNKDEIVNMIEAKIKAENEKYNNHMGNNPTDEQRKHDHSVIMAVYTELLFEINKN